MAQLSIAYADLPLESETDTRLLVLYSRSHAEEITCSLINADLNDGPCYEALSYCWGSARNTKSIVLGDRPVEVRENLWSALWHLRHGKEDRILWVDALCINQEDTTERSHQVSIMGPIFSKSDRVLVWLGPASDDSDTAMDFLSGADATPRSLMDKQQAIDQLCHREYWQRMWILQEFCLAPKVTVHCGHKSSDFAAFWKLTRTDRFRDSPAHPVLCARNRSARKERRTAHLLSLIDDFADRKCMDPRDKVYAVVAMAADYQQKTLNIDYEKTLLEVYCDVFELYTSGSAVERPRKFRNRDRRQFIYGTTQSFPSILFSQVLRWLLEASMNDAAEMSKNRSYQSPWRMSTGSKRQPENRSFADYFEFKSDPIEDDYEEAQVSLQ